MDQLNERKAVIRSILLASGNQATEKSFRYDYYSQEGESFNRVLFECKKSFYEFMRSIPDVVRVWDSGDGLVLQRVSTEQSSHMDNLTVITTKKVRKSIPFRFRSNDGSYRRPSTRLTSYNPQHQFNYASLYENNHAPPPPTNGFYNRTSSSQFYPSNMSANGYSHRPLTTNFQNQNIVRPVSAFVASISTPALESSFTFLDNQCSIIPDTIEREVVEPFAALSQKSSSDWSAGSSKETCPKGMSLAEFCKTQKKPTFANKDDKVQKAEETPTVNYLKIAKFLESDLKIDKSSSLDNKSIDRAQEAVVSNSFDVNNYVTGTYKFANARIRQLKCLIFLPIKIIEVRSLSYFIFQYNVMQLETLTEEMGFHYKSMEASKHLSVEKPACGMSVATFNDGIWQRAEILMICPTLVLIRFVDTMKLEYVNQKNLRYLERTFAELPRKSCQGMIAGIEPMFDNKSFSSEAENEFKSIVKDSKMFAVINGVENEVFKVSLFKDAMRLNVSNILIMKKLVDKAAIADLTMNAILI